MGWNQPGRLETNQVDDFLHKKNPFPKRPRKNLSADEITPLELCRRNDAQRIASLGDPGLPPTNFQQGFLERQVSYFLRHWTPLKPATIALQIGHLAFQVGWKNYVFSGKTNSTRFFGYIFFPRWVNPYPVKKIGGCSWTVPRRINHGINSALLDFS